MEAQKLKKEHCKGDNVVVNPHNKSLPNTIVTVIDLSPISSSSTSLGTFSNQIINTKHLVQTEIFSPPSDSNQMDKAATSNGIFNSTLPKAPQIQEENVTKNLTESDDESNPWPTLHGSGTWCAAEKLCLNHNKAATSQFRCSNCGDCMHTECRGNIKKHFCLQCDAVKVKFYKV